MSELCDSLFMSANERGTAASAWDAWAIVLRALWRASRKRSALSTLYLAAQELLFDLRSGTRTTLEQTEGGRRHEGSNPVLFARIVRGSGVHPGDSTFCDLGAGKGRAMILALEQGFAKVVGVEAVADYCALARANLDKAQRRHPNTTVEIHECDAMAFKIPCDVNVAYLFNPFPRSTMASVVEHLMDSIVSRPRDFHVMYLSPRSDCIDLFQRSGFQVVFRMGTDGVVLLRRATSD
jgi:SAM-dependent methyltransferase